MQLCIELYESHICPTLLLQIDLLLAQPTLSLTEFDQNLRLDPDDQLLPVPSADCPAAKTFLV